MYNVTPDRPCLLLRFLKLYTKMALNLNTFDGYNASQQVSFFSPSAPNKFATPSFQRVPLS